MKTYRVTLKYIFNGIAAYISTTIPAYHNDQAIDKVTIANNLGGQVKDAKAIEVK